jgi:Putative peptidoglycan binding domain
VNPKPQPRNMGPVGSGPYVVQQNECLLGIALEHGFFWKTIWNLSANAELQRVRKDPGQLLAGDQLVIPEREERIEQGGTENRHCFVRRGVPCKLRLVIEYEDEPVSNSAYQLVLDDGSMLEGETNDQGLLEASISPKVSEGVLEINGLRFTLVLGALDPSSEDVGIQQRLANLGFYHGALDGQIGPLTCKAVAEFQARVGFEITGDIDDATLGKLLHRHDATHQQLAPRVSSGKPSGSTERQHV